MLLRGGRRDELEDFVSIFMSLVGVVALGVGREERVEAGEVDIPEEMDKARPSSCLIPSEAISGPGFSCAREKMCRLNTIDAL